MKNHGQSTVRNAGQAANGSQKQRTPEQPRRRKHKCAGVHPIRLILGVVAIVFVIVVTQIQSEGWQAILDVLFGGFTLPELVRYAVIVLLSMAVGYWMKKPRKVYFKGEKQHYSEAEQKAEE